MDKDNASDKSVEITYRSTELQPPLFLAGSFSSPPWTPLEMKHHQTNSGQHIFTKTIRAKPGTTVQYKFRVGSGDWWVLDESLPTSTDDKGNRNNVLKITEKESHAVERPPTPPPDSPLPLQSTLKQKELLSLAGTSTPGFVQTTLEVADTAAQIDPRTPELDVSDGEAGRTGYRRLSSTPIVEVADTAAEVAGVAKELDFDDIDDIEVDIGPDFSHELAGEEDNGQDEAPVFAYEFAGTGLDRSQSFSGSDYSPGIYPVPGLDDGGNSELDLKDPTLEKFPSNREGILERVRTLETGLTEDVSTFDGFPASPVVSAGRKSSTDLNGDSFSMSPTTAAENFTIWPQTSGNSYRPEAHRRSVSKESVPSERSPSLQCIMEENQLDEEDEDESALLSIPSSSKKVADTGLDVGLPKTAAAPPLPIQHTSTHNTAPIIVVHKADTVANTESGGANAYEDTAGGPAARETHGTPKTPGEFPSSDHGGSGQALSLALQQGDGNGQQEPRSTTTAASSQSAGMDTVKSPNWLHAFVRLVLVDWIGGLLDKIFRRRPA